MIIHPVKMETSLGGVRLSARVEVEGRQLSAETLWFEFPGSPPERFSGSSDGFLVALLLLAMARREDIQVHGTLDRRLLSNLAEYQRIFQAWFPELFHPVEIRCEGVCMAASEGRPTGVVSAFSGGVDSSYTLWSHLPEHEPDPARRITHALFVHGFDIPLDDASTFEAASARYVDEMRALGIELVVARTNVRQFLDELPWGITHGSALGSLALMLDRFLAVFYLPASFSYAELEPWGSHPLSDPLMSTATLTVIHDGCMMRCEKITRLAQWAPARSWLRVCWERPSAHANCCRCYKCVLTMISLDIAGMLDQSPTFPEPLEGSRIRWLRLPPQEWRETATIRQRAAASGRMDIVRDLRTALSLSRLRHRLSPLRSLLKSVRRRLNSADQPPGK
jgi:hypothetical protein